MKTKAVKKTAKKAPKKMEKVKKGKAKASQLVRTTKITCTIKEDAAGISLDIDGELSNAYIAILMNGLSCELLKKCGLADDCFIPKA